MAVKPKLRSTKFAEIKASLEAKTAEAEKKKEQEKQARQKAAAVNEQVGPSSSEDILDHFGLFAKWNAIVH